MNNNLKSQKGISLVALVVTIIVLLIVAGVAIRISIGDDGLIDRAQNSADKWNEASIDEQLELNGLADKFRETRNKIYRNDSEENTENEIENGNEVE